MKNNKIDDIRNLAPGLRSEIDNMILSVDYTYHEIADYISEKTRKTVTQIVVCRYARDLMYEQEERRYGKKPQSRQN